MYKRQVDEQPVDRVALPLHVNRTHVLLVNVPAAVICRRTASQRHCPPDGIAQCPSTIFSNKWRALLTFPSRVSRVHALFANVLQEQTRSTIPQCSRDKVVIDDGRDALRVDDGPE